MQRRRFLNSLMLVSATAATPALTKAQSNSTLSAPFRSYGKRVKQAPFGGEVSDSIVNYNRVSPYVANAGLLRGKGLEEAKRLGFKPVSYTHLTLPTKA